MTRFARLHLLGLAVLAGSLGSLPVLADTPTGTELYGILGVNGSTAPPPAPSHDDLRHSSLPEPSAPGYYLNDPPPRTPWEGAGGFHVVVPGDTLSEIAQARCGRASDWRRIFAANDDRIRNPNLIFPGQIFRITCSDGSPGPGGTGARRPPPDPHGPGGYAEAEALWRAGTGQGPITHLPLPRESFRVSSGFGPRRAPTKGASHDHKGIDLAAPRGTPVYAAGEGRITRVGWDPNGYGHWVEINHGGTFTRYGHLDRRPNLRVGQRVGPGQPIGEVGQTGTATGYHLHFEIRNSRRVAMNPAPALGLA